MYVYVEVKSLLLDFEEEIANRLKILKISEIPKIQF